MQELVFVFEKNRINIRMRMFDIRIRKFSQITNHPKSSDNSNVKEHCRSRMNETYPFRALFLE